MTLSDNPSESTPDVVLIGAGIMSATLGAMLKELQPDLSIAIFERLDQVAAESSDAWNNAGTGHSAFCELNYTPELADGSIETVKAVKIAESFELSLQFWSHLVKNNLISSPKTFINRVPHMSFVWGAENVNYLKKRHAAMTKHPLFQGMAYSEDHQQLREWMPLIMEGRNASDALAATHMPIGTDVDFGSLTRHLFNHLKSLKGVSFKLEHEVRDLDRQPDGSWLVKVKDLKSGNSQKLKTKFVFIGAGGGALHLLQKSGIPEHKGFGGFPVSGQWLVCENEDVVKKHQAKVYGKASVGSPPMSVPHLDTRMINGKRSLLFGPYAGFSTKFLKTGSYLDLPKSIKFSNMFTMLGAGVKNLGLTKYLIEQVVQSPEDRLKSLQEFMPTANPKDWKLEVAGQRVQVIKHDPVKGGVLEFGTEVVSAADGSVAALLGASPGASTAVSIMITLIQRCFKDKVASPEWQAKLKKMIPSYGQELGKNPELIRTIRQETSEALQLPYTAPVVK